MDNTEKHLGQFITTARESKQLSENKLAENSGIPRTTLRRKIENPDGFTLEELTKISRTLGCKPSKLTALYYSTKAVAA